MGVFFIGCLHLQHHSIAKYRGFNSADEHDDYLIKQWNSVVNKKDKVFVIGDISMESHKPYYKLDLLNGLKTVCLGNHDMPQHVPELLKYVHSVAGMVDYKGWCLQHSPIHPSEIGQYIGCIHAHIHHENKLQGFLVNKKYNDLEDNPVISTIDKYFNVDAHLLDYKPVTLEQIKQKLDDEKNT